MSDWRYVQRNKTNGQYRTTEEGGGGGGDVSDVTLDGISVVNQNGVAVLTTPDGDNISYDNTTSGMTATSVQDAIDEIAQDFQDGCNTISQAVIAKGQTPASNSPSDIAYAISQISGGGEQFTYRTGAFYGSYEGEGITSLSVTLSGTVGEEAIIIIMHRASIIAPNAWTYVDKKACKDNYQYVSIYRKVLASTQESYTVTQSNGARMCGCSLYFKAGFTLTYYDKINQDSTSTNFVYRLSKMDSPMLVVINQFYSGRAYLTSNPAIPMIPAYNTNNTFRLIAMVQIAEYSEGINVTHAVGKDSSSVAYNNAFRWKIE